MKKYPPNDRGRTDDEYRALGIDPPRVATVTAAMAMVIGAVRSVAELNMTPHRLFLSRALLLFIQTQSGWAQEMRSAGTLVGITVHGFDAGSAMIAEAVCDEVMNPTDDLRVRIVSRATHIDQQPFGRVRMLAVIEKRWNARAKDPPLVAIGPWLPILDGAGNPITLEVDANIRAIIFPMVTGDSFPVLSDVEVPT